MKRNFLIALASLLIVSSVQAKRISIPIESNSKGYYLLVDNDNRLRHIHFGDKVSGHEMIEQIYQPYDGGIYNSKLDAYPTFGRGYVGETAILATHADGNMTTRLIYDSHTTAISDEGNVITTTVKLRDEYYPLSVTLSYRAYQQEDIFTTWATITNNEKGDVVLERAMSNYLALQADNYYLSRYYGSWSGEMQMCESEIKDGVTTIDSKTGVRTTQDGMPSFILSLNAPAQEAAGEVILGSLAWSGNYKLSFEVDNLNQLNILSGVNDFFADYTLSKGESFTTPEMVLAHSSEGVGEASRNLHRWVRRYNLRDSESERPVVLNSWEGAYFDFDEDVIKHMIEDAASMGVEMFVLDDGWFGSKYPRNSDKAGLGDWEINYKKLPNGLSALIDHAHKNNIEFGLWVEPEMVNPKSALAEKHPDWIVSSPNRTPILQRNQLLLDLTNPKVQEFAYGVVADVLKAHPDIKYIKWDANRNVEDFGSSYLASDKQSHFWVDYIASLYNIYDRLAREFPDVIFQACSSGAGRVDYGSIKYHHELWGSDNTDAEWRIFINWGLNQFFPAQSVASHVSQSPNHQTKHISPIKFRFDVAMAQRLGVELQPKLLTEEELSWTKEAIEVYKERIRPVVQFGDQYRLISPYNGGGFASMVYVTPAKDSAILFAYSIDYHFREEYPVVKLSGLDPEKRYIVKEVLPILNGGGKPKYRFKGEGKVMTGDYLMKFGMRLDIKLRYESAVFEITEVK